VKDIDVFLPSDNFQRAIRSAGINYILLHNESKRIYQSAEQLLLSTVSRSDFTQSQPDVSVKLFSESFAASGRLDAEYYQPKYDNYITALKTSDTVDTLCNLHDKNFVPKVDAEYMYIELANVGSFGNISDVEMVFGNALPSRARRRVKSGQVIIASVEGSLQSCALITHEYDNALCSTGFYVLDSDKINPETLLVLFKSEPIQALLRQRCSGTILTAITKDELLNMPLPQIEESVQKQIALKVQESFTLRRESEQLLETAKRAVEIAIEQGEDQALRWLKEKGVEG
jgi:type I restriction enzyme S subunit